MDVLRRELTRNAGYTLYVVCVAGLWAAYLLAFFGIYRAPPAIVSYLRLFMHAFICVFLLVNFNPFVRHTPTPQDANIIFGSALVLFSNVLYLDVRDVLKRNEASWMILKDAFTR